MQIHLKSKENHYFARKPYLSHNKQHISIVASAITNTRHMTAMIKLIRVQLKKTFGFRLEIFNSLFS